MLGFHNQTCSTTYWEKGSWQVFKQVGGKLTQTMLSKAFLEELKSKDRQKIYKWNRTRITFSHIDKKSQTCYISSTSPCCSYMQLKEILCKMSYWEHTNPNFNIFWCQFLHFTQQPISKTCKKGKIETDDVL